HHDAGDDPHGEGHGEDDQPVFVELQEDLAFGREPKPFEYGEIAREPDRERRKKDVETHRECELHPREDKSIHLGSPIHSMTKPSSLTQNWTARDRSRLVIGEALS